MNIYIKHTAIKAYIAIILLILIPISAFSKSDFRVAYQIDDQIISNYDIDQFFVKLEFKPSINSFKSAVVPSDGSETKFVRLVLI